MFGQDGKFIVKMALYVLVAVCTSEYVTLTAGETFPESAFPYDVITPAPSDRINIVTPTMLTSSAKAMTVTWENSTTSSIAISWRYNKKHALNGTYIGSRVEYFLKQGKFRSHFMPIPIDTFVFENLKVATQYKICVTLFENVKVEHVVETFEHTQCFKLSTIPYIRRDSVLILLLSLSYFLFMGLIGYSQWRRKVATIRSRIRREDTEVSNSEPVTPVLRWRELEERQRLFHPTSSIEESPRLL